MSVLTPQANTFNFTVKKGQDYVMLMTFRDKETHERIDITKTVFEGVCRDHINSEKAILSFIFRKNSDPTTGAFTVSIARGTSAKVIESAGVYDMFETTNGLRTPFLQGKITFEPSATR